MTMPGDERAAGLLPCPFCGKAGEIEELESDIAVHFVVGCSDPECTASKMWGAYSRKIDAAKFWNTRASGWRDIASAPRDGKPILVFGGRHEKVRLMEADGKWWNSVHCPKEARPTHWMPSPYPQPTEPTMKGEMEPKPCPFCGEEPKTVSGRDSLSIFCNNAACVVQPETGAIRDERAITAWNRRASIAAKEG